MANPLLISLGSNIQSLASGALSSLIGGSMSRNNTRSMMRFQDSLNDQNALDAYNRQRSLMEDAASIQKRGMIKAGYNTAFGSNGSVMSVSNPSSSSVGLGSVDSNKMPSSFQTLIDAKNADSNAKVADAHSKLLDSQRVGQDIQNDYSVANILSDIDNKVADTRDKNSKARYQELKNNLLNKYGDRQEGATTGILENQEAQTAEDAALAGINRQIAQSTRPDKEAYAHELVENEKKKGKLLDAQVVTENGKVLVQQSEIAKNFADAENTREDTKGKVIDNEVKAATKADTIATLKSQRVKAWYDAQPKRVIDILLTSQACRNAIAALQNGRDLSFSEFRALAAVLGYENAGALANSLLSYLLKVKKANLLLLLLLIIIIAILSQILHNKFSNFRLYYMNKYLSNCSKLIL